jgi:hypothetical protein
MNTFFIDSLIKKNILQHFFDKLIKKCYENIFY